MFLQNELLGYEIERCATKEDYERRPPLAPPSPITPEQREVPVNIWRPFAACLGNTDPFFAEDYTEARAICDSCPVVSECLADAIATADVTDGFRGGMPPSTRRRYRAGLAAKKKGRPFMANPDVPAGCCKGCGCELNNPDAQTCSTRCRSRVKRYRQGTAA